MKLLFLTLFVTFIFGFKPERYSIEGHISTKNSGKVFLLNENDTLATTILKKGKFKFKKEITAPSVYTLVWGEHKNERTVIFVEGQNVKVDVSNQVIVSGGGNCQKEWSLFLEKEREFEAKQEEIKKEYKKALEEKNLFSSRIIWAQDINLNNARSDMENDFIRRNDNILGAYLIKRRIREFVASKKVTEKYELLGKNGRQSLIGQELYPYYESDKTMKVGFKAPDFLLKTTDGKELSLYEIKSKVKIIDFWASWCTPCRAANPDIVKIYNKYHSKGLEIVSVSLDTKREKWEEAIKADNLTWIHLSSLKGWSCPVVIKYGVKGVPTVIVVDEKNQIIANGPDKQELEKILSNILD